MYIVQYTALLYNVHVQYTIAGLSLDRFVQLDRAHLRRMNRERLASDARTIYSTLYSRRSSMQLEYAASAIFCAGARKGRRGECSAVH